MNAFEVTGGIAAEEEEGAVGEGGEVFTEREFVGVEDSAGVGCWERRHGREKEPW